ncbi:MAG: hypothetical protein SFY95_05445 [Planctomycetota bacterium]|nr:hypothetical protein [Planctomycetota bacterium]
MIRSAQLRAPALIAALAVASSLALAQPVFHRLGLPPGDEPQNPAFTDVYGVSNNGIAVGSMYVPNVGFRGFRWTLAGGLTQLDGLAPGSGVFPRVITPDGLTIAGENTGPQLAFRLSPPAAPQGLEIPDENLYDATAGTDASDDGSVVVGLLSRIEDGTFRAARWSEASGWQDLGAIPGDDESRANAVSGDGSIVAGFSVGSEFSAVKWDAAGNMTVLPIPSGAEIDAAVIAMSSDGAVLVGQVRDSALRPQAAVWTETTASLLPVPEGFDSASAFGANGDGSVIVGVAFIDGIGGDEPVIWRNGQASLLRDELIAAGNNLTGWDLIDLSEVSPNGVYVVGRALNPDGLLESFLAQLAPACVADFDGSGFLDSDDFVAFVGQFTLGCDAPGSPDAGCTRSADFDGTGFVDSDDFVAFVQAFASGC